MKKVFKEELQYKEYNEIRIIDMETGEYIQYMQDKKIGFTFSKWETNIFDMGYKSVKECLKTLKERNYLGTEIDYKEQRNSEKIGFINLGIERIKRNNRVNTNDFKDVIEQLANYGLGFCDAQNQIIAAYEYTL